MFFSHTTKQQLSIDCLEIHKPVRSNTLRSSLRKESDKNYHLLYSTMIPAYTSITTRIGCRPGMASLSFSRQRLAQPNNRVLQGCRYAHFPTTPRTIFSTESIKKYAISRFLSTGGAKSGKGNINSMTQEALKSVKKSASEPPVSTFSKFWKAFLAPKPMPERWSAAWYQEMVLVCTVFAITGSSTMVLVSWNVEGKARTFDAMYSTRTFYKF